ncbi:hypothetical protein EN843_34765, partial [Mesorhizobium sp. M4B.F.Ca.ET.200.01.1.1]
MPLLLAAAACVPQDGAPKAASAASPAVSPGPAQQPAASIAPSMPATPKTPGASPAPATKIITDLTAPRSAVGTASYRCGNGGVITIQNLGRSLRVVGPDGVAEEFA